MKICPKCQKTYNDENLNFCLDDGSVLSQSSPPPQADKLPETVMMSAPRTTSPNQPVNNPTSPPTWGHQQQQPQQQSQPAWGATPNYQTPQYAQPQSKTWIWVLGILAAVVVVCGGGGIGLIALVASMDTMADPNRANKTVVNGDDRKTPVPDKNKFEKIDLSGWTKTNPIYATSEYKNGEFILGTKNKNFYYVVVATEKYQTDDSITRLTVRNVEEKPTRFGYGLIFHSNPTPLTQDYGFLIDADKQRYRVVKHSPGKETDIIKWTKSTVIKSGTQKNVLEVRDSGGEITFYINGQKIDSIKNTDGYKGGVPGVYTGDAVPVGFSDFEVGK